jgi:hypothetical protein
MLYRARFDEFDNDVPAASVLSKSDLMLENILLKKSSKIREEGERTATLGVCRSSESWWEKNAYMGTVRLECDSHWKM